MNEEKVRCAKCGFLALKQLGGERLVEVDLDFRNRDNVQHWEDKGGNQYIPLCFVQASDLTDEISKLVKRGKSYAEARVRVIHRDRPCGESMIWRQGFSPRWHYEMKERREWQEWLVEESRKNKRLRIMEIAVLAIIPPAIAGFFAIISAGLFAWLGYYLATSAMSQ